MSKKLKLFTFIGAAISSLLIACNAKSVLAYSPAQTMYHVDFFNNYQREDFVLSNGQKGKGNNLIYQSIEVGEGALLQKPADPARPNYEFQGWFLEETGKTEWNFAENTVTGNLRLFAKWGVGEEDLGTEPAYNPPSTVLEESNANDYVIDSVMNFKIDKNQIKVGKAALSRLSAHADNVLPLMEYKVKASKTLTATYANNVITVTCGNNVKTIAVKDDSETLKLDNASYETKASNYEKNIANEDENYHVMLAGSSSIEFWTTSKEDLQPIVSYNHGIGGTTIEQWDEQLNQRLVFPYKPKMVVYYVGINNVINSKQSAETIWTNLQNFFDHTHAAMPDTKVQYIMMNLIPGYKGYWNVINAVNAQVQTYQRSNPWLTLINPGTALLKANGEPNAAYFRVDGLHLSYYGYVVWGAIIKQSILEGLKK